MKHHHPLKSTLAATLAVTVAVAAFLPNAPARIDGIHQLITVTQMKADAANDQALQGAERQRQLVEQQKQLRKSNAQLDTLKASAPIRRDATLLYDDSQNLQ